MLKLTLKNFQLRSLASATGATRCSSKNSSGSSYSCMQETEQMNYGSGNNFSDRGIVHSGKNMSRTVESRDDRRVGVYSASGRVNLNSVTQSTVPKPFKPTQNDSPAAHKNILGGANAGSSVKLVSNNIKNSHQNRNYSTYGIVNFTNANGQINACHIGFPISLLTNVGPGLMFGLESKRLMSTEVKLSQKEKLKKAVKDYGITVVIFHVSISLISLGGFYLAVSSGLDMSKMLSMLGGSESLIKNSVATGASTFVVAYAVHKVFAPVRIGITLTATPFIVGHLRKIGVLSKRISK